MNHETENFDQLPDAIVKRLRVHDRGVSVATPRIDAAIHRAAEAQFTRRFPRPAVRRWYYPAAAAAAAAVIAVIVTRPFDADRGFDQAAAQSQIVAEDVDASGRVDILDAFALARAREDDPSAASQARIDSLASRIVSLSEGVL
jgi:hypothetical protein